MFATVRRYSRLPASTVDDMSDRAEEIRSVLEGVPGFTEAHLIRTRDGLIIVTLGEDEACLVEAGRRFVAWVNGHVPGFRRAPVAQVWPGDVLAAAELDGHATADLSGAAMPRSDNRPGSEVSARLQQVVDGSDGRADTRAHADRIRPGSDPLRQIPELR